MTFSIPSTDRSLNLTQLGILIRDGKEVGVFDNEAVTYLTHELKLTDEEEAWLRTVSE